MVSGFRDLVTVDEEPIHASYHCGVFNKSGGYCKKTV